MKILKVSLLLLFLFIATPNTFASIPNWGATGHRTVGQIAQEHLKKSTQRKIKKLLKGESLALVATFGDDIKSDKRFKHLDPWHYVNVPAETSYEASEKNPEGDMYQAILTCIDTLKNNTTPETDKVFYLKMLVHLMGDLHQPMHVGNAEDKGGNRIQVQWFKKGTNLHRVWDSDMIEHFGMSYKELAANRKMVAKNQIKAWQKGSVADWLKDTHQLTPGIYNSVTAGQNLGYEYMYTQFDLARMQLQKGGVRLAKVLNEIYK